MSLFWRIFLLNAAVLTVATTLVLAGPVTVSTPVLLTRGRGALGRAGRDAGRQRGAAPGRAGAAVPAHPHHGRPLTAVLLELKRVGDQAPAGVRAELAEVQETTRNSLDEIRRIARRLRPGVLAGLGLESAIRSLATEFSTGDLQVRHHIDPDLPDLGDDRELVLYRVAQEALTDAARHSGARTIEVCLRRRPDEVRLRITDDGKGFGHAPEGAGIRGMRERALLIGAALSLGSAVGGGADVRLRVPCDAGGR
ncbi:ATP-binding protein [Asanoa sp. NPDC049518]|uniref:sensor histidine kinase n=1 Tax=unclassified Asanoa TaxID=2685164 RepID=UPI0034369B0E